MKIRSSGEVNVPKNSVAAEVWKKADDEEREGRQTERWTVAAQVELREQRQKPGLKW